MLSLCSRNLYSFTLFMIQHFSLCSEKIETHFPLSYLLHHPLSNVLRWSRRGFSSSSCNTAVAQRLARGAHNSEVTRSKRVSGIILFACFTEARRHCYETLNNRKQTITAVAQRLARGAHNPEDTGSKPVSGIILFAYFTEARRHCYETLNTATLLPEWRRGSARGS